MKFSRMVITDLDGTLLRSDRTVSPTDFATLEELGRQQILRVIATGRSLYSAKKVLSEDFPLDYLVFSSGAGILDWPTKRLLLAHHLRQEDIELTCRLLIDFQLDFMLHRPVPDNHHFWYYATGRDNPDFIRRRELYQAFASPFNTAVSRLEKACQFVAIEPQNGNPSCYETLRSQLKNLKVIRTTSPLDATTLWIEIFPKSVSKALAGEWLEQQHQLNHKNVFALGNDYNDLDLLEWAENRGVVSNAPPDLRHAYPHVGSHNENGFSEAVKMWINY